MAVSGTISANVLNERFRVDTRHAVFTSHSPRLAATCGSGNAAERSLAASRGPGTYSGLGLDVHPSATPAVPLARAERFARAPGEVIAGRSDTDGVDTYYDPRQDQKEWFRRSITISKLGRESGAVGGTPAKSATDEVYDVCKRDLGRRLPSAGNSCAKPHA